MSKSELRAETYQDLLDEHVKLRGMLRDLESRLAERRGPFTDMVAQLTTLRDLIDSHFASEEASECFPDLIAYAPRVADRVSLMLAEHGELRSEVYLLVKGAGAGTEQDWVRLADCFRGFTDKLVRHEQTENELVQEVFTDDIGSKD
jgi:hemerythrin-like domain-containing protein